MVIETKPFSSRAALNLSSLSGGMIASTLINAIRLEQRDADPFPPSSCRDLAGA